MAIQVAVQSVNEVPNPKGTGNAFLGFANVTAVVTHDDTSTQPFEVLCFRRLDATNSNFMVAQDAMNVIRQKCNAIGIFDNEHLQEVVRKINAALAKSE